MALVLTEKELSIMSYLCDKRIWSIKKQREANEIFPDKEFYEVYKGQIYLDMEDTLKLQDKIKAEAELTIINQKQTNK